MAENPHVREVYDFIFKEINKHNVTELNHDVGNTKRQCLLAVSNKYGLLFVANKTGIKVYENNHFHNEMSVNNVENEVHLNQMVNTGVQPSWLVVNADNTILSACIDKPNSGTFILLFDLLSFADKNANVLAYCEIRLTGSNDIHVLDLKWNPGENYAGLLAVCTSDGTATLWDCTKSDSYCLRAQAKNLQATCLCWSPKGKQIVIGKSDSSFGQYDQLLQPKRQMPALNVPNKIYSAIDILWESTHAFFIAFIDTSHPELHPEVFSVSAPKGANPVYVNNSDICFDISIDRKFQYSMKSIAEWNMVICVSVNAVETAVLGKCINNPVNWEHWILDEGAATQMPLKTNYKETFPLGIAYDFTPEKRHYKANDVYHELSPNMYILSDQGILIAYTMINSSPNATKLNTTKQVLSSSGARIPKFPIVLPIAIIEEKPIMTELSKQDTVPIPTKTLSSLTSATNTNILGCSTTIGTTDTNKSVNPIGSTSTKVAENKPSLFSASQTLKLGTPLTVQPLARQLQFDLKTPIASSTPFTSKQINTTTGQNTTESAIDKTKSFGNPLGQTLTATKLSATSQPLGTQQLISRPLSTHSLAKIPNERISAPTGNLEIGIESIQTEKSEIDVFLYRDNILFEMQSFQLDLDEVRKKTNEVMNVLSNQENTTILYTATSDHHNFINDVINTTHSIAMDIDELRNSIADGFVGIEQANKIAVGDQNQLQSRSFIEQISPNLKRSLNDYISRCQSLDYTMNEIDENLDSEWEEYIRTKVHQKKSQMNDSIYTTLANNSRLICSKRSFLRQLTNQLKDKYKVQNKSVKLSDLNNSMNNSTNEVDKLNSKMKDLNIENQKDFEDNLKIAERSYLSPDKCDKIRNMISLRKVNNVSSPKPSLSSNNLFDRVSILEKMSATIPNSKNVNIAKKSSNAVSVEDFNSMSSINQVKSNLTKTGSIRTVPSPIKNYQKQLFNTKASGDKISSPLMSKVQGSSMDKNSIFTPTPEKSLFFPTTKPNMFGDVNKTSLYTDSNKVKSPTLTSNFPTKVTVSSAFNFNSKLRDVEGCFNKSKEEPSNNTLLGSLLESSTLLKKNDISKSLLEKPINSAIITTANISNSELNKDNKNSLTSVKPNNLFGDIKQDSNFSFSNKISDKLIDSPIKNKNCSIQNNIVGKIDISLGLNNDSKNESSGLHVKETKDTDPSISKITINKQFDTLVKPIFGDDNKFTTAKPIFGDDNKFTTAKPIFGGDNNSTVEKPIFGGDIKSTAAKSIFGGDNKFTTAKPIFGGDNKSTTAKPIFGDDNKSTTAKPIFGGDNKSTTAKPIFGDDNKSTTAKPIFGDDNKFTTAKPIFGDDNKSTTAKPIFGGDNKSTTDKFLFGIQNKEESSECHSKNNNEISNLFGSSKSTDPLFGKMTLESKPISSNTINSGIFGSTPITSNEKAKSTGIFTASSKSSIFGENHSNSNASTSVAIVSTIFGDSSSTISKSGSIFGTNSGSSNIFGTNTTTTTPAFGVKSTTTPTFGASTITTTLTTNPVFGSGISANIFKPATTATPIFGATSTATPAFGASTITPAFVVNSANTPIFGDTSTASSTFGVSPSTTTAFGSTSTITPAFGSNTAASSIFGVTSTVTPTFGVSASTTSAFGVTSTATAFGSSIVATPIFGANSTATPAFGESTAANSMFGTSSNSTPAFGANTVAAPIFGTSSTTFGASSTSTPAFGASSTPTPAFGTTPVNSIAFGVNQTTPAFGSSAVFGSPSAFGGGVSGFGQASSNAPIFGSSTSTAPAFGGSTGIMFPQSANSTGFGSIASNAESPSSFSFGASATPATSTFGQSSSFANASDAFSSYR